MRHPINTKMDRKLKDKPTDTTVAMVTHSSEHKQTVNGLFSFSSPNIGYCWKCASKEERDEYQVVGSEILMVFVYCWFAVAVTPFAAFYLFFNVFVGTKSTSRTIGDMMATQDWKGIIEMQAYKGDYGVFDADNSVTLLMLAVQHNYGKLVAHIMSADA